MTPEEIVENMQYHILQIESHFEDAYNMELDLSLSKKSFVDKLYIWKYYKKNFPEDFGEYNDGYLGEHLGESDDSDNSEDDDDDDESEDDDEKED